MIRTAIGLCSLVFGLLFLSAWWITKAFNVPVPITALATASFIAAVGGSWNTLREDVGLSFLGHFLISTILAFCVLSAVAGVFTLSGHLEGLPRWLAVSMLAGGVLLFISLAAIMGRGPSA